MQKKLQSMESHRTRPAGLNDLNKAYGTDEVGSFAPEGEPAEPDMPAVLSDNEDDADEDEDLKSVLSGGEASNKPEEEEKTPQNIRLPPSVLSKINKPNSISSISDSSVSEKAAPKSVAPSQKTEATTKAQAPAKEKPPPENPLYSEERQQLLKQLDVLRLKFKEHVIPPNIENEDTRAVRLVVERNLLQLKRARNVAMYRTGQPRSRVCSVINWGWPPSWWSPNSFSLDSLALT